jgi:hypothetical protein
VQTPDYINESLSGDSTLFIHEIASDWPMTQGAILQSVKV